MSVLPLMYILNAMRFLLFITVFFFVQSAEILAAGLVPCGSMGQPPCQACHLVELTNNVIVWIIGILALLIVIAIVVAGFVAVTSRGQTNGTERIKTTLWNVFVGFVFAVAAWLIINTLVNALVDEENESIWNVLACIEQPVGRLTASGDNLSTLDDPAIASRLAAIRDAGEVVSMIEEAARQAGITDPREIAIYTALISQESSLCRNTTGPSTRYGTAYGCGQMLVSTARLIDPNLRGLSDQEVAIRLRDDDAYNLSLSAQYFNQQLQDFGSTDLALAAYNGGPGANLPSRDCPGLRRWQCEWNEPGCYNTGRTDCARNQGFSSYEQTRNYVANINRIADGL